MKIDELQEIKERCENTSKVEFSVDFIGDNCVIWENGDPENASIISAGLAELISHAVADVPALLAEVERLQAEAVTVQQVLEQNLKAVEEAEYWKSEADRLRKENEMTRAALDNLANDRSYSNAFGYETPQHGIQWVTTEHDTPWEYAQSKLDQLKGEDDD